MPPPDPPEAGEPLPQPAPPPEPAPDEDPGQGIANCFRAIEEEPNETPQRKC
jgi:hypothetical protein